VANELIDQLKQNSEMQVLTGLKEASSYYDDDDSSDEDSPPKKARGSQSNKKMSLQKWEKNVRRRVYDALNVLYAAGVLKKEGKQVFCDNTAALL